MGNCVLPPAARLRRARLTQQGKHCSRKAVQRWAPTNPLLSVASEDSREVEALKKAALLEMAEGFLRYDRGISAAERCLPSRHLFPLRRAYRKCEKVPHRGVRRDDLEHRRLR